MTTFYECIKFGKGERFFSLVGNAKEEGAELLPVFYLRHARSL